MKIPKKNLLKNKINVFHLLFGEIVYVLSLINPHYYRKYENTILLYCQLDRQTAYSDVVSY